MFDAQTSAVAAQTGLSPGGVRRTCPESLRGRALTNLPGVSPDRSVPTNHPLYCGEVFCFAKMQILPNKPILKTHNTLPANEIQKTLRLLALKTNPIQARNQTDLPRRSPLAKTGQLNPTLNPLCPVPVEPIRPYSWGFSAKKFAIFYRHFCRKSLGNQAKNSQKTLQNTPQNHAISERKYFSEIPRHQPHFVFIYGRKARHRPR